MHKRSKLETLFTGSNHATYKPNQKHTMQKESCSGEYYANLAADGKDCHDGYWPSMRPDSYWPPLPVVKRIETPVSKLRTLEEIIASNPHNLDHDEEGYETPQQMGWVDSQGRP